MNACEGGLDLVWKLDEGFSEEGKKGGAEGSYVGSRSSMCKGPEAEETPCVQGSESKCDGACKTCNCNHVLLTISSHIRLFSKFLSFPHCTLAILRS